MNGIDVEKVCLALWAKHDQVRERLPHLSNADVTMLEKLFAHAIEPLESFELDRAAREEVKLHELSKAIGVLELLKRARRTGYVEGSAFTTLISRNARRVERLARQLSEPTTRKT